MSTVTISALYVAPVGYATTIGATALTWTAGQEHTLDDVVARIGAAFSSYFDIALDPKTGYIDISPIGSYTLVWGHPSLAALLGFTGAHAESIDESVTRSDRPCMAYWAGRSADPWGHTQMTAIDDAVSPYGRTTVTGRSALARGSIHIWAHRRGDAESLADAMARIYAWADQAVRYPLTVQTVPGESSTHAIAEGWECAPMLLDDETVMIELETTSWCG